MANLFCFHFVEGVMILHHEKTLLKMFWLETFKSQEQGFWAAWFMNDIYRTRKKTEGTSKGSSLALL